MVGVVMSFRIARTGGNGANAYGPRRAHPHQGMTAKIARASRVQLQQVVANLQRNAVQS